MVYAKELVSTVINVTPQVPVSLVMQVVFVPHVKGRVNVELLPVGRVKERASAQIVVAMVYVILVMANRQPAIHVTEAKNVRIAMVTNYARNVKARDTRWSERTLATIITTTIITIITIITITITIITTIIIVAQSAVNVTGQENV